MSKSELELLEIVDTLPALSKSVAPEATPNRQLYENSQFPGSDVELALLESEDRFHNTKLPNLAIIHEKPEHRIIVYLKAEGHTNREIAAKMGYSEAHVSQITRQIWFQRRLIQELKTTGRDNLNSFLKVQAEESLMTLVHLRDHAKSEQVRVASAVNLLDRFLGKPVQRSEVKLETSKGAVERAEDIDTEMRLLREEERKLLGEATVVASPSSTSPLVASVLDDYITYKDLV